MAYEIKDKVVIITGGCGGIGKLLVHAFLKEGAKFIAILDVEKPNGVAFVKELEIKYGKGKAQFYKCDVTKELEEVYETILKEVGYVDVVVNNAGIMNDSPRHYLKEIEVNFTALVTSSLKAFKWMRKDHGGKGGTIINISSIAGIFQSNIMPVYYATKTAVLQFSNCLGLDPHYSRSSVRVITICFGATDTSLLASQKYGAFDDETDHDDLIGKTIQQLPMQTPQDAVNGLIEAYKNGASASTWLVSAGKPAKDITANVNKGYEIMSQGVFEK